ncbi:aldehyde dehydrogenase family protein, partial [Klebsiella pneumoniae]|uniref:aldehyde dehydrogenase family protein n=1 Tax=Klebsiella pneumoniae TaxID=573 RepID=UPI0013D48348
PLVSFPHMESVLGYIESGKAQKARLLCGGERVTDGAFGNGAYVAPTVFTDCRDDMTIVREEIFGPGLAVIEFEDAEEAVRIANDTPYGLAAAVLTSNLSKAHLTAKALRAGSVWV